MRRSTRQEGIVNRERARDKDAKARVVGGEWWTVALSPSASKSRASLSLLFSPFLSSFSFSSLRGLKQRCFCAVVCPGMSAKVYRLLFMGAPGVGKGTYSARAAAALQCCSVSSGDLLRREVAAGTPIGKEVKGLIETGVFVPDALITKMVVNHLSTVSKTEHPHGYILDGYPRNIAQAKSLWESGAIRIDHVLNLTQPTNVIIAKVSSRRSCPDCGFVYNSARIDEGGITMDPLMPKVEGVCDKCGSTKPLLIRKDDELSIVRARLEDYEMVSRPVLEFYRSKGIAHDFPVLGGTKLYLPKLLDLIHSL